MTSKRHDYNAYTRGCRCEVCRRAKADYMAERRAAAYLASHQPAENFKHGRAGYEEQGCRCDTCVDARRGMWRDTARRGRAATLAEATR